MLLKYLRRRCLAESQSLQQRWINKGSHHRHPFELLDLYRYPEALISKTPEAMSAALTAFVIDIASERSANFRGFPEQKLRKFSIEIFCGLLLGCYLNSNNPKLR